MHNITQSKSVTYELLTENEKGAIAMVFVWQ